MSEKRKVGDTVATNMPIQGNLPGTEVKITEVCNAGKPVAGKGYLYRIKREDTGWEGQVWEAWID